MQTMKTQASRRLDVQGLRALVALVVILFHAGLPVPGGFIGVDIFVISGFVITQLLVREREMNGRVDSALLPSPVQTIDPALGLILQLFARHDSGITTANRNWRPKRVSAPPPAANFVIASSTGGYFDLRAETNPLLNTWSSQKNSFTLSFRLSDRCAQYCQKTWPDACSRDCAGHSSLTWCNFADITGV